MSKGRDDKSKGTIGQTILLLFVASLFAGVTVSLLRGFAERPTGDVRIVLKTPSGEPVFNPSGIPREKLDTLVPWVTVINSGGHAIWPRDFGVVWSSAGAERRVRFRVLEGRPFWISAGDFRRFRIEDARHVLKEGAQTYVRDVLGRELRSSGSDISEILKAFGERDTPSPGN